MTREGLAACGCKAASGESLRWFGNWSLSQSCFHERLTEPGQGYLARGALLGEDRRYLRGQTTPFVLAEDLRRVDDHRDGSHRGLGAQPAQHLETIQVRHVQVEEDCP